MPATQADVAQLVEHFTRNEGVRGSNPRVGFAPGRLRGARAPRSGRPAALGCAGLGGERGLQVGGGELEAARPHRGRTVRAGLPEGLERGGAMAAPGLELRRADGADEEGRLDARPADRALRLRAEEVTLERPELGAPSLHVGERLGRTEEEVGEGARERHEPEERRRPTEPGVADPAPRVAVDPEREAEPEEHEEEEREVPRDLERRRMNDRVQ
jgi:hypothetical protein